MSSVFIAEFAGHSSSPLSTGRAGQIAESRCAVWLLWQQRDHTDGWVAGRLCWWGYIKWSLLHHTGSVPPTCLTGTEREI